MHSTHRFKMLHWTTAMVLAGYVGVGAGCDDDGVAVFVFDEESYTGEVGAVLDVVVTNTSGPKKAVGVTIFAHPSDVIEFSSVTDISAELDEGESHIVEVVCKKVGTEYIHLTASFDSPGDEATVNCTAPGGGGNGGGGNGGGGNGGGGNGGGGNGGGGNGGNGGNMPMDPTDPQNDCISGDCDPEMDMVSANLTCDDGPLVLVEFAAPMATMSDGESSRVAKFYTANDEHMIQATAFASSYSCSYRLNFAPLPLPDGTTCEILNGRFVVGLPAAATVEQIISVELESGYYDGMSVVTDEFGPLAICE